MTIDKIIQPDMHKIESIAIIGAGALGAVYGSILSRVDSVNVCFIANNERYDRLVQEGVTVNGTNHRIAIVRPEETFPVDLLIVAVKYHELDQAIADMKQAVGSNTTILSVMNGIDSEERIGAVFGMDKLLYGLTLGIDAVRENDSVTYQNLGRILFGEKRNDSLTERVARIADLFTRANIAYENPPDMIRSLWYKFMINVGVNQASALLRATYGELRASVKAQELMDAAMLEVITIAQAEQVNLTKEANQDWYKVFKTLGSSGKTSMLQDVEAGRRTEVDMLAGTVIRLAEQHGIPTPINRMFFDKLSKISSDQADIG